MGQYLLLCFKCRTCNSQQCFLTVPIPLKSLLVFSSFFIFLVGFSLGSLFFVLLVQLWGSVKPNQLRDLLLEVKFLLLGHGESKMFPFSKNTNENQLWGLNKAKNNQNKGEILMGGASCPTKFCIQSLQCWALFMVLGPVWINLFAAFGKLIGF